MAGEDDPRGDYGPFRRILINYMVFLRNGRGRKRFCNRLKKERFRESIEPKRLTSIVKKVTRYFGANLVGTAKYDPKWVYTRRFVYSGSYVKGRKAL